MLFAWIGRYTGTFCMKLYISAEHVILLWYPNKQTFNRAIKRYIWYVRRTHVNWSCTSFPYFTFLAQYILLKFKPINIGWWSNSFLQIPNQIGCLFSCALIFISLNAQFVHSAFNFCLEIFYLNVLTVNESTESDDNQMNWTSCKRIKIFRE